MIRQITTRLALSGILVMGCGLMPTAMMARQEGQTSPDSSRNIANANREMVLKVRRDVARDTSVSKYGRNVKVVANGGKVTLSGVVSTPEEKKAVVALAQRSAGNGNVVDRLTVVGDR